MAKRKLRKGQLGVGYLPGGAVVGLDTGRRRYGWQTSDIPAIVQDLRELAKAKGPIAPVGKSGFVFKDGKSLVLTDERPSFESADEAGNVLVDLKSGGYVFNPKRADELADHLMSTYRLALQVARKAAG